MVGAAHDVKSTKNQQDRTNAMMKERERKERIIQSIDDYGEMIRIGDDTTFTVFSTGTILANAIFKTVCCSRTKQTKMRYYNHTPFETWAIEV